MANDGVAGAGRIALVGRMVDPIDNRHVRKVERTYALQAGDIDAVLVWVRAAAMVGVDAARRAEIVLRRPRIEAIEGQRLFAGLKRDVARIGRYRDRAARPAIGA